LTLNGGLGNDTLIGSGGDDVINGGDGTETVLMGGGNDTFVWNPGDDNDTLEGQAGTDTMVFNGANVMEQITIAPNGGRVIFFRDIANVTMDLNDVERIDFNALGGADTIVVNDMMGTDLVDLRFNLAAALGGGAGDGSADNIIVNGTSTNDVVIINGDASGVAVLGLAYQISISGAESANDRLRVNLLGGDDVLDASGLLATGILLTADGGNDEDILTGWTCSTAGSATTSKYRNSDWQHLIFGRVY
jgi:hypothetical protein